MSEKAKLIHEVFRDGTWVIVTDKMFPYGSETYTVGHDCEEALNHGNNIMFRYRPYAFQQCTLCMMGPPDGFKVMFKFLLQSKGEEINNLDTIYESGN